MICRDCNSCVEVKGGHMCFGVKEPFYIYDINTKCTEYFADSSISKQHANITFGCDESKAPKFIMLVGVPGSGKTNKAKNLAGQLINGRAVVHISSDNIRERIYGDAGCQDNPAKVFSIMHEETIKALRKGFNVVYDATNINRKNRKEILDKLPDYVVKECIICWAPIDLCIKRDSSRERTVGTAVIDRMLRRFEAPFYDEGFTKIEVSLDGVNYDQKKYYFDLLSAIDIPHDNPHHSTNVLEHCRLCGMNLIFKAPTIVVNAGYIHDIGKAYTKTFKNRKGEDCDIAHYYDHQAVGAWLSYGIEGHSPTLAWLVSTHMAPFINQKYFDSLPPCYREWIELLHEADRAAH